MKKVINGSRYDTDTAKKLAEWESGQNYTDFNWYSETLYRTKAGKWFLHGQGGAATAYADRASDGWSSFGERIIPLSEEAAKSWAEKHLDADKYASIFAVVSDGDNVQATIYIPAQLADKLTARMNADGCSRNELILKAISEYLK